MIALRRWTRLGACLLFLLCFAFSRSLAKNLEELPDLRVLDLSGTVSGELAGKMRQKEQKEEKPVAFTVWGQETDQTMENPGLGRSVQGNVISLSGSSALLFSTTTPLLLGDQTGCLLSENVAQQLFGSSAPVGGLVEWKGRTLTVRGIVHTGASLMLVQALEKDELGYVAIQAPEGGQLQRVLAEFQNRHSVSGIWSTPGAWALAAELCSLLPVLAMLLPVIFSFLKTAFSFNEYPLVFLAGLLLAGMLWFFLLWATGFSLQVPLELLPARWSDFDFWGSLAAGKKEELLHFLASEKTSFDLEFQLPALGSCCLGLTAVLLFSISLKKLLPKNGRALWLSCALLFVLAFLVSLRVNPGLVHDNSFWLCPAVFLAVAFLAEQYFRWAKAFRAACPLADMGNRLFVPEGANGVGMEEQGGR